jgi:anti-anti-sigma factor
MGDAVVTSVSGSVDYGNATGLRRQLMKVLASDPVGGLVLELGSVESMDTAAAAVLVEVLMAGQERNIKVFLCGSSPSVQRLFQLSGLDEALECCCDSPAEVQEKLRGQAGT